MEAMEYRSWVDFYSELADKLRPFEKDRAALIAKIKDVYTAIGKKLPTLEKGGNVIDIDPFSIFGMFNKGITNANRLAIISGLAKEFEVAAPMPAGFDGIPVLNNLAATFYRFIGDRGENDIDNLWGVFLAALDYAQSHSSESKKRFIQFYDRAIQQKGIRWNLTMGLFWIRPYEFVNLDSRNRWYLSNPENMPADLAEFFDGLEEMPSAADYLDVNERIKQAISTGKYDYKNLPELSNFAWRISEEVNEQNRVAAETQRTNVGEAIGDKDVHTIHYWVYSPGYGSAMWEKFYADGVMAIAREYIGDLSQFASRKEMQERMRECGGDTGTRNYKNASLETWQFVHELKPGDVIFAKSGKRTIVGRGIVTSEYYYDESYSDEYRNLRKVNWTHKGEWEHPGNAITKVLTDVTPYTD